MFGFAGIVGSDTGPLVQGTAAVTGGFDLDLYFSLSTGRDLSRVRDSSAASTGFDIRDFQRLRAPVLDGELVAHFDTLDHGLEFPTGLGEKRLGSRCGDIFRGLSPRSKHQQTNDKKKYALQLGLHG